MISVYYFERSICLLLATDDYTLLWEICQFETISRENYSGGIYFSSFKKEIFFQYLPLTIDDTVVYFSFTVNFVKVGNVNADECTSGQCIFPLCTELDVIYYTYYCLVRYNDARSLHLASVEDDKVILAYFNVYIILKIVLVLL